MRSGSRTSRWPDGAQATPADLGTAWPRSTGWVAGDDRAQTWGVCPQTRAVACFACDTRGSSQLVCYQRRGGTHGRSRGQLCPRRLGSVTVRVDRKEHFVYNSPEDVPREPPPRKHS